MLKIKYIAIESLKSYRNNSKIHPDFQITQIQNSIKEFGFFEPIHVDEDNTILSGHARVQALEGMEETKVPAICLSGLNEEQKSKIVIASNKIQDNGSYNMRALHDEINFILSENPESDLKSIGFSDFELESLLDMDFTPFLEPVAATAEVTSDNLQSAETKMSDAINHIQQDKSSGGLEVMCPYCAESFKVTGT